MSSPPPASVPTVWPPSNPSGTLIPFPLPWGQTGCCPPGGMDALMKCYCDIQQASAFIGQVMIDQINNNPAIIAAIIAGLEKSGSNVPLIGVTNGSDAQPGQVGEWDEFIVNQTYPTGTVSQSVTAGILQPGDWDIWANINTEQAVQGVQFYLLPTVGVEGGNLPGYFYSSVDQNNALILSPVNRALISVPTLFVFTVITQTAGAGGTLQLTFLARRRR